MEERKKRWGDRKDAYRVRNLDAMHVFAPYLMPNRADNEAFVSENIEIDAVNKFLEEKNKNNPEYKYTIFHIVAAALAKTIYHRPKMNRFISGHRLYERKKITLSFIAKKQFTDEAEEAIMFINCDGDTTIDTLHDKICDKVMRSRQGEVDNSTNIITALAKLPRCMLKIIMGILKFMDYYGIVPDFVQKEDPDYATVFISNLGSIKLNAAYHHLTNWGNTSIFLVIGEKHFIPVCDNEGNVVSKEVLPLGITLDERIADGYYYSKTIKLLKYLLQNPKLLELPAKEEVVYERTETPMGKILR